MKKDVFFVELFWENLRNFCGAMSGKWYVSLEKKLGSISYFRPQSTVDGSEILHELIYIYIESSNI